MRSAETLSQSRIDTHSPQHSPIGREPQYPRGMTSTITILPSSPLELSRSPFSTSLAPAYGSDPSHQRPKLSLNTSCSQQRTLGKGNTGLRLDTLSASSPTIRNTYKNSYEAPTVPATPFQAVESGKRDLFASSPKPPTPHPLHSQSATSCSSSSSSTDSSPRLSPITPPKVPYVLGKHPRSILTNSPLPKRQRSQSCMTGTISSNPCSRPEPSRRVGFHQNLEENIHTQTYTAQHYDLLLDSPSPSEELELRTGSKRESPCDDETSEDDWAENESYPKTPVAGRKKRRREWVWTLGPIEGAASIENNSRTDEEVKERPREKPQDPPRIAVPKIPGAHKINLQ